MNETRGFRGKAAFVTGGASGIGRAAALAFAREGTSVAVADVSGEGSEETLRLIEPPYSYTRIGKVDDPSGLANALGAGTVTVTFAP